MLFENACAPQAPPSTQNLGYSYVRFAFCLAIEIIYQNHSIKRLELSKFFFNNELNKTKLSDK
ncbi:hypothetical protein [Vibrio harveyi]|uniref:hypothetical protein n=1 Tax=Vibrio harveyi TaxID=669 RepID=UPI003BAA55D0